MRTRGCHTFSRLDDRKHHSMREKVTKNSGTSSACFRHTVSRISDMKQVVRNMSMMTASPAASCSKIACHQPRCTEASWHGVKTTAAPQLLRS
jgi:hypothetical protein